MADVLIASDADWVHDEVRQVLAPDTVIRSVHSGPAVRAAVAVRPPDVAVVDLQIGSMGGMAIALDLHLEAGMDRLAPVPILLLLDRRPDVYMARQSGVEGFLIKPLDPIRLRRAIKALLDGGTYEDTLYEPRTVLPA